MTDLPVRWGMVDFKKWGDPSNRGDDFEKGGLIPLYGLWTYISPVDECTTMLGQSKNCSLL